MKKEKIIIGWIVFKFSGYSKSGKTEEWFVKHKDDDIGLGVIKWNAKWRQYVFEPLSETLFKRLFKRYCFVYGKKNGIESKKES